MTNLKVLEAFSGESILDLLEWLIKLDNDTLQLEDIPEQLVVSSDPDTRVDFVRDNAATIRTQLLQFIIDSGGVSLRYMFVPSTLNVRFPDGADIEDPDHY